jgi:hypothetical protein
VSTASVIPEPFTQGVKYGRTLVGGKDAVLEWNGSTIRLSLSGSGEEIFDLRPEQISRVRDDQRMTLVFKTKAGPVYHVAFAGLVGGNISAAIDGAIFPGMGAGAMREAALSSPVNVWLTLLGALGIRVRDNTFVPPSAAKTAIWAVSITVGAILLVCIVAFVVIFVTQG